MPVANGKLKFANGWLPDQEDYENPGLIEALNVIVASDNYQPYLSLTLTGSAVANTPTMALRVAGIGGIGIYVGASDSGGSKLYFGTGSGGSWTNLSGAAYFVGVPWSLQQYNEVVIATNGFDPVQIQTIGGGNFANLTGADGTPPLASVVGTVGQFLILGNLSAVAGYAVQWNGINDPTSWPTPNSATAIAKQSGRQYLEPDLGVVVGISQGDQWGLILMNGGIVRMTYIGGTVVFQFDTIYKGPAAGGQYAWIKIGNLVYFASSIGFFKTDGTQVVPIGRNKVDQYFLSNVDPLQIPGVQAGYDFKNRVVFWSFAKSGHSGVQTECLAMNIDSEEWTHVADNIQCYVQNGEAWFDLYGFQAMNVGKIGTFTTQQTATITTGEAEFNIGGRTYCAGVKPLVAGGGTMVSLGYRDNQTSTPTFTSAVSPNSFTGFSDFMIDARYMRAQLTCSSFNQAIGVEFLTQDSGTA